MSARARRELSLRGHDTCRYTSQVRLKFGLAIPLCDDTDLSKLLYVHANLQQFTDHLFVFFVYCPYNVKFLSPVEVLWPNIPLKKAGIRMLPAMSEPMPMTAPAPARIEPSPPETERGDK